MATTRRVPETRRIEWDCEVDEGWEWQSGSPGNPLFPSTRQAKLQGTIDLPPREGYWYPCADLFAPGHGPGNAYICYSQNEIGVDQVQAITVGQGNWTCKGPVDDKTSTAKAAGGIVLTATFA